MACMTLVLEFHPGEPIASLASRKADAFRARARNPADYPYAFDADRLELIPLCHELEGAITYNY